MPRLKNLKFSQGSKHCFIPEHDDTWTPGGGIENPCTYKIYKIYNKKSM